MHIRTRVSNGEISYNDEHTVQLNMTNLNGTIKLCELEAVLRVARDLDRRVFPVIVKKRRR